MVLISICADFFMEHPLHKEEAQGKKNAAVLKMLIERSPKVGVQDIVLPCVDQSSISNEAETERFVRMVSDCATDAVNKGVNISLETDLAPEPFGALIKALDSPCIKVNYDIGNSASLGYDPSIEFDTYGTLISDVHIKDRVINGGTVPLGSGDADIKYVLKRLSANGFSGPLILQAARKNPGEETQTIREYMNFVTKLLEG